MKLYSSTGLDDHSHEGEIKCLNSELWHACAGPLVSLPNIGSHVVYFPQGHSEQVVVSMNKAIDGQIPNHPSLPSQLICYLHDMTMHADTETDEVYAQMILQPLNAQEQKEVSFVPADMGAASKQPTNYFCKTLTASDTSTHGGFSVPRRAAEKVFPPLDFSMQPPCQELIARDLHNNEWKFRHIFRGQPKRHLLTTGWSVFVSAKRLVAGDSVLFIWNDQNQLLLGIRRAYRPQNVMPSSVLSSDSMHLGLLAAAAHAAATNSRFSIFFNPRASPSEFVIPLTKYVKAVYHTRVSVGMRFRMLFETEESSIRRYMGTITGISDLDSIKWPNSHWRSVKVGWDESTAGKRQPRVSLWEIEPLPIFPMYQPSPFSLRLKRPWPPDLPSFTGMMNADIGFNSSFTWPHGDVGNQGIQSLNFQGTGLTPWIQPRLNDPSVLGMQNDIYQAMASSALQEMRAVDPTRQILSPNMQIQQPQILRQSQSPIPYVPPPQSHFNLPHQQLCQTNSFNNVQIQQEYVQQQQQHVQQLQQQQQNVQQQEQQLHVHQYQQQQQQHHVQQQHVQQQQQQHVQQKQSQLFLNSQAYSQTLQSMRQNFSESPIGANINSPLHSLFGSVTQAEALYLVNGSRSSNLSSSSSTGQQAKRIARNPRVSDALLHGISNQLETSNTNVTQIPPSLPPFPGIDHEGINDAQNHFLFGVNIDSSSLLMPNGISNLKPVGSDSDNTSISFASPSYVNGPGSDYIMNANVASRSCIDELDFMHSENLVNATSLKRTFVKVYKSGSYGRSLDISMFSSYHELRSELGHMFGLEGQLEDPLRSGWQLVFVDRENDVLLLGDDPWQEFVNNVWCIKILSPKEVQDMGKRGLELLSSVPKLPLPNGGRKGGYVSRQEGWNKMNAVIPSVVGTLDF